MKVLYQSIFSPWENVGLHRLEIFGLKQKQYFSRSTALEFVNIFMPVLYEISLLSIIKLTRTKKIDVQQNSGGI